MQKATAAIVGSGMVGTDMMYKLLRHCKHIEARYMIGMASSSNGLARAAGAGLVASPGGIDWLMAQDELPDIVFDSTSSSTRLINTPMLKQAGIVVIDLTSAKPGPYCVPAVNLKENIDRMELNMATCGAQATVPIVAAISKVVPVQYAEAVSSMASQSVDPGTRAQIDGFTKTTEDALIRVGGAARGKAITILNPAEPPMIMRCTVFCSVPPAVVQDDTLQAAVYESIRHMVEELQATYVPGLQMRGEPQFEAPQEIWNGMARVAVFLQVKGQDDFLPAYAGNLDIVNAAAARVADLIAQRRIIPARHTR